MRIIDADKFLTWLVFSKHIDGLTCGEVKEAIEMCKVDILDKIRDEIEEQKQRECFDSYDEMFAYRTGLENAIDIIDKYKSESEKTK